MPDPGNLTSEFQLLGYDTRTSALATTPGFSSIGKNLLTFPSRGILSFDARILNQIYCPPPQYQALIDRANTSFAVSAWTDLQELISAINHCDGQSASSDRAGIVSDESQTVHPFPQNHDVYLLAFAIYHEARFDDWQLKVNGLSSGSSALDPRDLGYCVCSWDGYDAVWDFIYSPAEYTEMRAGLDCLNAYGLFPTLTAARSCRDSLAVDKTDGHYPYLIFKLSQISQ